MIARLLDRLERVKEMGPGRWVALCPAHEDRSPSLSLRELDDGRMLVHCFAGCAAADVVAAVGLSLADLYPQRLADNLTPARDRKHIHAARQALKTLHREVLIVAIAGESRATGEVLDEADRDRLWLAVRRIREAAENAV